MILSYEFIRCSIGEANHGRFESLFRRMGGGSWDFYSEVADTSPTGYHFNTHRKTNIATKEMMLGRLLSF